MKATIDSAGRLVVPKVLREAVGLGEGGKVEITEEDGRLVVTPAPVPKRLERRDGQLVCVPEEPLPPLTADVVRSMLDATRP